MELNDEVLELLRMHTESLEADRQDQSPDLSLVGYLHEFVSDFEPSFADERDRNSYSFGFLEGLAAVHGMSACQVLEFGRQVVATMGPLPTPSFDKVDAEWIGPPGPPPPPPPEPNTDD